MRIAILGCGPSGLIAAHACVRHSIAPIIYSYKRKSQLYGSQYLHEPIPGIITPQEGEPVKYVNIGSHEEYRRKTHGKYWDGIIAPEDFETEHVAWNIREAYDRLWRRYSSWIHHYNIPTRFGKDGKPDYSQSHPYLVMNETINISAYDLVISTVPRRIWAMDGERYVYSMGWALGDAPEDGIFVPYNIEDMHIECNGDPDIAYNRLSCVFGYKTVEWPDDSGQPGAELVDVAHRISRLTKPLLYEPADDDRNPVNKDNWLHVGRYGEWKKGILVSDTWHSVNQRLESMLGPSSLWSD